MAFHLGRDIQQLVDLGGLGVAGGHALHHPPHPARALAAGGALAAAFVPEEPRDAGDHRHQVGGLVDHDGAGRAQARSARLEVVEVH